jgi:hypothetical protein
MIEPVVNRQISDSSMESMASACSYQRHKSCGKLEKLFAYLSNRLIVFVSEDTLLAGENGALFKARKLRF